MIALKDHYRKRNVMSRHLHKIFHSFWTLNDCLRFGNVESIFLCFSDTIRGNVVGCEILVSGGYILVYFSCQVTSNRVSTRPANIQVVHNSHLYHGQLVEADANMNEPKVSLSDICVFSTHAYAYLPCHP